MVAITPVESAEQIERLARFPWQIYRGDAYWVPPYLSQQRKRLDVNRNPFFQYAERRLFAAYQDGEMVGTIAAIFNRQYDRQIGDRTGFFGFFETVDDLAVAEALLEAAGGWLRSLGMERLRGPVNGAPTDEAGVLILGHRTRPSMWEGHNPAYYQGLLERLGFEKHDDLFAYEVTRQQINGSLDNLPAKLGRAAGKVAAQPEITIRSSDRKRWDEDVVKVHHIYNTAFRTIPDHTDMSLEKFLNQTRAARPFLDLDLALLAEVGGMPAGFAVALPDINEVLQHFNGEISPLGALKFRWYLKRIRTACFKLLGVLPEYRGRGIEARLILEIARRLLRKNYQRLEISLASEKNLPMNRIIRRMGGRVYRQYRIYQRRI